ncbi:Mitochondrial protein up-regulated during meiosis [Teratosphaeria destructans]|uniref:Mitochondrial protein up-regulated during meiosis n=1 Tax=Teratosphaeria destructans TaxID=418781 RepID=A0A9W7T0P4_9PEZI|nr:Mitochondrial protein up-regulated during meiosis [Teratosphaeria destructans]
MVRNGGTSVPVECRDEKLIVKWKTCGKTRHRDGTGGIYRGVGLATKDPVDRIKEFIAGGTKGGDKPSEKEEEEFQGIFVFEFDDKGRVKKHIIERTEEGGHWDKTNRVVSVTDWLLGRFNGRGNEEMPELALCEERPSGRAIRLVDRRGRFD